jgi:hypothetical protein
VLLSRLDNTLEQQVGFLLFTVYGSICCALVPCCAPGHAFVLLSRLDNGLEQQVG